MEAPERIEPKRLGDYLEVMSKSVFQSGMSWKVVESKWEGFRSALDGFDAERVAAYDSQDVERLVNDARIIRNRRKIEATIHNAQTMVDLEDEFGDLRAYLRSYDDFEATAKDLRKRFKFLGDLGAFHFLYVVGEAVPSYEDWCASRGIEPRTS
jgi:DNA-3-methyladenine glycosylase I